MNELSLKPPRSVPPTPKSRGEALKLPPSVTEERLAKLALETKKVLDMAREDTQPLRRRLEELRDLYEGVVTEVTYPFPNASDVDPKLAIGTGRTFKATIDRALFPDPEQVFIASLEDDGVREKANAVETAFNWKAAHENGLVDAQRDAVVPAFRDGMCFIEGHWEREIERAVDYKTYLTRPEFEADYPDAKAAGMSEEAYAAACLKLETGEEDAYVDVCFDVDLIKKDHAIFSVVPLARFDWWPLSAADLDACELYGVRLAESEAVVKAKRKRGEYFEDAATELLESVKGRLADPYRDSQAQAEGLSPRRDVAGFHEFDNERLYLKVDLDDDDVPEFYTGVFNVTKGIWLSFDRYKVRYNTHSLVPMGFERREGRLLRRSLLWDGADLFGEIRDLHRHRHNRRMITDSPAFKADESIKDTVAPYLENWHPGIVVWLPNGAMDRVQQFEMVSPSKTEDQDEEGLLNRYVEFVIAPLQGLSGQQSLEDKRAPASKHLSQLRQAGIRVDDYAQEFKRSTPDLGRLCLALYYQHGPAQIPYMERDAQGDLQSKALPRADIGLPGIRLDLNIRSITMSPEFEMERVMALRQEAAQNPYIMARKPEVLGILWDRFVTAARVSNPEELKLGNMAMMGPPPMMGPGGQPAMPVAPGAPPVGKPGIPPLESLIKSLGGPNGAPGLPSGQTPRR